jgi:hypothetical protein
MRKYTEGPERPISLPSRNFSLAAIQKTCFNDCSIVPSLLINYVSTDWAKARSQPQRLVQRAQVVLMAAEGIENQEIAALAHFATNRGAVEAAFPGVARGRAGKIRSASGPDPTDQQFPSRGDRGGHATQKTAERHALERAHDGQSSGSQRGHRSPHLAAAQSQGASSVESRHVLLAVAGASVRPSWPEWDQRANG